ELAARFAGDEMMASRANALAARLTRLADEDAEAYKAFMENRNAVTRLKIVEVPEAIAAVADEIAELAVAVRERVSAAVAGDADAAAELARAAARVARRLAALNA